MRYWWVNHKQTFRQEFGGKYVWCPKKKKSKNRPDGITNHFYETVREVRPDGIIFSYADGHVQGFGFASTHAYSCPQPDEFGRVGEAWDKRGWRVDVSFQSFLKPLKPADHATEIAPLLPTRYSPVRANGHGNQGAYLAEISEALALVIAELADPLLSLTLKNQLPAEGSNQIEVALPELQYWEDRQQRLIETKEGIPETTRQALILARRGQGKFKEGVSAYERACRITQVDNPTHLIASHIKPWRESDDDERLAAGNGLLLTPSIDHLFDRGFISYEDNGELIASPVADTRSLGRMGVATDRVINVGHFNTDQRHFLDYHRKEIFLKSAS